MRRLASACTSTIPLSLRTFKCFEVWGCRSPSWSAISPTVRGPWRKSSTIFIRFGSDKALSVVMFTPGSFPDMLLTSSCDRLRLKHIYNITSIRRVELIIPKREYSRQGIFKRKVILDQCRIYSKGVVPLNGPKMKNER